MYSQAAGLDSRSRRPPPSDRCTKLESNCNGNKSLSWHRHSSLARNCVQLKREESSCNRTAASKLRILNTAKALWIEEVNCENVDARGGSCLHLSANSPKSIPEIKEVAQKKSRTERPRRGTHFNAGSDLKSFSAHLLMHSLSFCATFGCALPPISVLTSETKSLEATSSRNP